MTRRRTGWPGRLAAALLVLGLVSCGSGGGSGDDADGRAPAPTGPRRTAGTYLSLGDSYAQGFQPGGSGLRQGFAYLLPERAAAAGWELDLVNLGCGGATIESLQEDEGCPAPARSSEGPVYDEPQLDAAVSYLEDHPGEVALITVIIGGNDITRCARGAADPIACVTEAVGTVQAGLDDVLPRLRDAAGPETTIVGLTYPDVILGAYVAGGDARQLAELSVVAFERFINPMLRAAYESVGGVFVDVTTATGAFTPLTETTALEPYGEVPVAVAEVCRLTWFCQRQDIHPRDEGYATIADLIVAALPAA